MGGSNSDGYCCGSTLPNTASEPGLVTGVTVPIKFSIAHELGHVIAGMRMGGREISENPFAPQDGCLGDYRLESGTYVLVRDILAGETAVGVSETGMQCINDVDDDGDTVPNDGCPKGSRGEFSKEYMAQVLREAWGNFVSVVTWNSRSETDCEFQVNYRRYDFDLDGDIDFGDAYAATATRSSGIWTVPGPNLSGTYDCDSEPQVNGMNPGAPPVASYVSPLNWLEDVEDADDDDQDGVQCVRYTAVVDEYNRSTVADATAMFWDLTTAQALTPDQLSDLYVDMCPRHWTTADMVTPDASMPRSRLSASANFHSILPQVSAEVAHISH